MPKAREAPKPFRLSHEHRGKIQNSSILNALIEHVEGARDMSQTQVTVAIALLRKVLPDLSTVTLQGDEEGGPVGVLFQTVYEPKPPNV